MKKRRPKSKKTVDSQKIEHSLQAGLEHIASKWGWYVLGIFGLYALYKGWILGIFSLILEWIFYCYHWFTDGIDNIVNRPISSLTLSNIGDLIFRLWIAFMIYVVVKSIYEACTDKDESEDSNI
jgi:hypothetical protein